VLDRCVARVKHEKCGELFETTDEAMNHTCVAETLTAGDDVLLLKGQLASDAAARRRERASHRNTALEAGTLATKIREATDDLFLLLARATEVVDFDERQQLSDEKERSKR
jgi:predicted  nucleic acid-binding Zn-ribbon protein